MSIEIIDCEQGTEEWFKARLGIPTASMYSTVMAKGRGGNGPSKTRQTYLYQLAGERLTGEMNGTWAGNAHTERGHELEPQAREQYAFAQDVEPVQVGFIRNGDTGCSPDSLVGEPGLLEIKTKLPHLQIPVLLADELPSEHMPQVQGQLWVAEREWCDFVSYWPGLPLFVKRIYRDESYITRLSGEVGRFNAELDELTERLKRMAA